MGRNYKSKENSRSSVQDRSSDRSTNSDRFDDKRKSQKYYAKKKKKGSKAYETPRTNVATGEPFDKFSGKEGMNDVAWYAGNPQMLSDAASYSYNAALGSKVGWGHSISTYESAFTSGVDTNGEYADTFPGILTLNYVNYSGISRDNTSPINIAADNVYSFVRHANSGHANYDEPDIMMYLMAIDAVYSFIAYGRRAYGSARLFNQKNYYYQRALIEAQGFDYDDLIANLANFRLFINTIAAKASSFAVPATMPIMQRHFFMASNIYKDSDTEKAQLMLFQPIGFHKYGLFSEIPETYRNAGALGLQPLPTFNYNNTDYHLMTVAEYIAYGNDMINRLLNSEDIGIISGDILKAFQGKVFTIPTTPDEYVVMPVYQPEVLLQIQNARAIPQEIRSNILVNSWQDGFFHHFDIVQDPNTNNILADPALFGTFFVNSSMTLARKNACYGMWPVISCNVDHPTPSDTMIATRLSSTVSVSITDSGVSSAPYKTTFTLDNFASEIIVEMVLTWIVDGVIHRNRTVDQVYDVKYSHEDVDMALLSMMSNFDHHPFIFTGSTTNGGGKLYIKPFPYLGNMDTYRVFTPDELNRINSVALLSMYGVPTLGTY